MDEKKVKDELKTSIFNVLEEEKYKKIIIIVGLLGILLIFLSSFFKKEKVIETKVDNTQVTVEQYTEQLEKNLKGIVSSIKGAGDCRVLVTVENGKEIVYATQTKKNIEEKKRERNKKSKSNTSREFAVWHD